MNELRITILGSHDAELRNWLTSHPEGHERGAIVLFRRISRPVDGLPRSDRFISIEVIRMADDWILESSKTHFVINMRKFPEIYLRCELECLELGFIHNHPEGFLGFSERDDINEKNILHGYSGCNGAHVNLISLVLSEGNWIARTRNGENPLAILSVRHISVLSSKMEIYGVEIGSGTPENLARQEAAFGSPFNAKMKSLRVAVVGLGGTGSQIAVQLARIGVGELILIDGDELDASNMNRVRGYVAKDVGNKKAHALSGFIDSLGLGTKLVAIDDYIHESGVSIDAISSADVLFGCTDDTLGRDLMNQAIYYYSQVFIDLGLAGAVEDNIDGQPYLRSQKGRVSCILPEHGACLRCQKVISEQKLYNEQTLNDNPHLQELDPETLEREHYIIGGGVQSPGIGAFTGGTADNAIATLMNLIREFRDLPDDLRQDNIWIDFVHMYIHSNEPINNPDCIYCKSNELLLASEGKNRLGMPKLGEIVNND